MKMYDMRCPSCSEFAGFKYGDHGRPECQGCGYTMTGKDMETVLDAVWEEHKKENPSTIIEGERQLAEEANKFMEMDKRRD